MNPFGFIPLAFVAKHTRRSPASIGDTFASLPESLFVHLGVVHKDTAAIFAHDKFLTQTYVGLTLRREYG